MFEWTWISSDSTLLCVHRQATCCLTNGLSLCELKVVCATINLLVVFFGML